MRFLLGSSFFDGGRQFRRECNVLWHYNNQMADIKPCRTVVISEGGSEPFDCGDKSVDIVRLTGDLGHIGSHLNGSKQYEFTGWSASMTALAMLAYVDEADFIYKEEDCFAFGPWVRQMYEDMGNGDMVFGPRMTSKPWMPCAQSLFLVRHSFIPQFVSTYLSMGKDGDLSNLGETKFVNLESKFGTGKIKRLSFGVDRERPIPFDSRVFYVQQCTQDEINDLKSRKLL